MKRTWVEKVFNTAPGFLAAIFYGIVSGSMSFVNKIVLTSYKYHYPDVIMLAQVICTSLILELCRRKSLCDILPWTKSRSKEFALPSLCFAMHTTLALAALDDLSIPIYNVLRRLLPLSSLVMTIIVLRKTPSKGTIAAVSFIVLGTFLAGYDNLSFHISGFIYAILSVLAQSIYLTYVQKTGLEERSSALSVLHLNSINCIPLIFLFTIFNGNLKSGLMFESFKELAFSVYFIFNIMFGCLLNYSLFLCATTNSALTTSFVGVIKGVITTIIGFFTFGGVLVTVLTVSGVTLNAFGGILYTYIAFTEKKRHTDQVLSLQLNPNRNNVNSLHHSRTSKNTNRHKDLQEQSYRTDDLVRVI